MITIFRKIRQNLIAESKMSKYLQYAIGEVLLVVIGILLAVGINSWYGDAQNEKQIDAVLIQVQKELVTDIKDAKRIFNFYIEKSAVSRSIMNDEITREMYEDSPNDLDIGGRYVSFSNKRGGYLRLLNNLENLPERYRVLLPDFNTLYVELQNDVDDYNSQFKESTYASAMDYLKTVPKMSEYWQNKHKEEALDFYMSYPYLKNKNTKFINDLMNLAQASNDYRTESILLYKKIDSLLGNTVTSYPDLLSLLPKENVLDPYLGEYERVGGTLRMEAPELTFKMEGNQLKCSLLGVESIDMYWGGEMFFYEREGTRIHRVYSNEKGQHAVEVSDGWDNLLYVLKKDL